MKRSASATASTSSAKRLSRMQIEALAQAAVREGLSEDQVAYEQWVDTQPFGTVVAWDELGEEERGTWCVEILGRGGEGEVTGIADCGCEGDGGALEGVGVEDGYASVEYRSEGGRGMEAVGDLGESRWIAVRTDHAAKEKLDCDTQVVAELGECPLIPSAEAEPCPADETSSTTESSTITERSPKSEPQRPFRYSARVWTATTTEESSLKNKPQCPPCARLKRTWTRCRGGPPCIECQHRGLSAEQCQSYDLLNRSRKNRLKKRGEKSDELGGETEIESIRRKESVVEDVMAEEENGETTGLKDSGERGDSDDDEEAQ